MGSTSVASSPGRKMSFARVARLKFSLFRFKSTFSPLNRPHRKAPLRSARYACARYARHPWRGATVPTRRTLFVGQRIKLIEGVHWHEQPEHGAQRQSQEHAAPLQSATPSDTWSWSPCSSIWVRYSRTGDHPPPKVDERRGRTDGEGRPRLAGVEEGRHLDEAKVT